MPNSHIPRRSFLGAAASAATSFAAQPTSANDRISPPSSARVPWALRISPSPPASRALRSGRCATSFSPTSNARPPSPAGEGHQPKEVRDFRQILADRSIDAVCISTPDHWHPYITVEACKAGKDVYVEKPACVAVGRRGGHGRGGRKYNRVVQAGTWQRSGAHFQKACEMVRSGELGKIAFVPQLDLQQPARRRASATRPEQTPPPGLDWDLWLGPAPARPVQPQPLRRLPRRLLLLPLLLGLRRRHHDRFRHSHARHRSDGVRRRHAHRRRRPRRQVLAAGQQRNSRHHAGHLRIPGFLGSWEHRSNNTELPQAA